MTNVLEQYLKENPGYSVNYLVNGNIENTIDIAKRTALSLVNILTPKGVEIEVSLEPYKDKGRHGEEGLQFMAFVKCASHEECVDTLEYAKQYLEKSSVYRNIESMIDFDDKFGLLTARVSF